jgi:uncharacterized protein YidB (DUF937 family)
MGSELHRNGEGSTVDTRKLAALLDDPEVRVVLYGLAHVYPGQPTESGAERLRGAIERITETVEPEQVQSWLSDETANQAVTGAQIQEAFGDRMIGDLARYAGSGADEVTWQLTAVVPDLIDALSPGGVLANTAEIQRELIDTRDADQRSAGPFGPNVH